MEYLYVPVWHVVKRDIEKEWHRGRGGHADELERGLRVTL
jgi:hypothetical protein